MSGHSDEFAWIASLASLTLGDDRALALMDDAAVLPQRPGHDLVISKDAMVGGVHFLVDEGADTIARRLLRTSLSDLAAKAAEPFGYLLLTALPFGLDEAWRAGFAAGLAADGREFGVALLGGDTVATPGPLTVSATVLGWVPKGRAVLRSGARAGDALVVCGTIGDAWLGLKAARGELVDPDGVLAGRYRLPHPLFELCDPLRACGRACADVSDGLIADAGHIALASGLALAIDVEAIPLSAEAKAWADSQGDEVRARLALATGGDDYALVVAVAPESADAFIAAVKEQGVAAARVGVFSAGAGVMAKAGGRRLDVPAAGWRHQV
jgi:thiamine-monophosphate kinase